MQASMLVYMSNTVCVNGLIASLSHIELCMDPIVCHHHIVHVYNSYSNPQLTKVFWFVAVGVKYSAAFWRQVIIIHYLKFDVQSDLAIILSKSVLDVLLPLSFSVFTSPLQYC